MTAPARSGTPSARTSGATAPRERELQRDPERSGASRGRSTAAERAYARRASRKQRLLRVVPTKMPGLASKTPFVLLVMGLLAAGVLATLFLSLSAVSDSYKLETAKNDVTDLSSKVEQLKSDVAKMESPEVLYDRAKQLGMVAAPEPVRVRQNPDGSVTVVGSAIAATPPPPPPTTAPATTPLAPSSTTPPPASGGGR